MVLCISILYYALFSYKQTHRLAFVKMMEVSLLISFPFHLVSDSPSLLSIPPTPPPLHPFLLLTPPLSSPSLALSLSYFLSSVTGVKHSRRAKQDSNDVKRCYFCEKYASSMEPFVVGKLAVFRFGARWYVYVVYCVTIEG